MIVFEKIRWKNFLSTGQQGIEVNLNKDPMPNEPSITFFYKI